MPPSFLARATLVDSTRAPRFGVPVRPFAFDLSKGSWGPIGEVRFTDEQGYVELDLTGSPPVSGLALGLIALRHEDDGHVLAEQWASYAGGSPTIFDFGEVRVWDSPIASLSERPIAGVPAPIVDALDGSATIADLQAQLASAQDQLTSTQAQLGTVQAQLASTQGQLGTVQTQLVTVQGQLATTQGQLTTAQNALAVTQTQLTSTQNSLVATQGQLADLQGEHAATLGQLADLQGQLDQLASTHAGTLAELASVSTELAELQASLGTSTSLEAVVDSVGGQLQATQGRLVANGSPFQLGRVSLSLKVVPSSSTSFGFATIEQLTSMGGEALSTLDLDFSQTAPASAEPPPGAAMPSVVGLTEPAARRRLAPLGLGASVVHQAIADDGDVALAGRVLKQIPAAGATIQPGQAVTLVLGKALAGVAP